MKFKKATAVLLSAATLASMPVLPVTKGLLQDTVITAEAADTEIGRLTVEDIGYRIFKTSSGSKYATVANAFANIKSLTVPATVTFSGEAIPVTKIEANTFASKYQLTSVNLYSATNLTRIGTRAFYNSAVTDVTLNSSVTIENEAFANTYNLRLVKCLGKNANVTVCPYAFENSGMLAFYCNAKRITLQRAAFWHCTSLIRVNFGTATESIYLGEDLFFLLYQLKEVTFDNRNASVSFGKRAFLNSGVDTVILPKNVQTIPEECFMGCNLSAIILPDSLRSIGEHAFSMGTLPKHITIGKNVTSIADTAFAQARGLESISVAEANNYYKSENGVLYTKNKSMLICYPQAKTDSSFSTTAKYIPDYAFAHNTNLKELSIPNFTRRSGKDTALFPGMTALEKLTIPSSEYYSKTLPELISSYPTLFSESMIHCINGDEMVKRPSNAEPYFTGRFGTYIKNNFDQLDGQSFMNYYEEKMADYVIAKVTTSGMTPIQKALHLRKWIIDRADYEPGDVYDQKNHTTASVFLHKKSNGKYYTVCEGYSRCYQLLMNRVGIKTYLIGSDNIKNPKDMGHAWNMIQLNGKWYHVDVTWDDPAYQDPSLCSRYDFFLCSDAKFDTDGHEKYRWYGTEGYGINRNANLATMDNRNMGDLNGDGKVTAADVTKLGNYVGKQVSDGVLALGDLNFDGRITAADRDMLDNFVQHDWIYYATVRIYALFKAEQ
ncbi:MAG: leucine-rich repeat protein [Oscillospiraceae bacterium]|nr:leucine-rich repeat protein [Oscillospiraceae bacterium]